MSSPIRLALVYTCVMIATVSISITLLPRTGFYPCITVLYHDLLSIEFVYQGYADITACEQRLQLLKNAQKLACPSCRILANCSSGLDESQRRKLTSLPLVQPSARLPDGVAVFASSQPEMANEICTQTEKQLKKTGVRCFMPNQHRPLYR